MRHLKIELVGYRSFDNGQYRDIRLRGVTVPERSWEEPLLRVEIDKKSWDEMFDLYETHIFGRRHPAVQDAWDQYIMTMHLCGNDNQTGTKKI